MASDSSGALVALQALNASLSPVWGGSSSPNAYDQMVTVSSGQLSLHPLSPNAVFFIISPAHFSPLGTVITFKLGSVNPDFASTGAVNGLTLAVYRSQWLGGFETPDVEIVFGGGTNGISVSPGTGGDAPGPTSGLTYSSGDCWYRIAINGSGMAVFSQSPDGTTWTTIGTAGTAIPSVTTPREGDFDYLVIQAESDDYSAVFSLDEVKVMTGSTVTFDDVFAGTKPDATKWLPSPPSTVGASIVGGHGSSGEHPLNIQIDFTQIVSLSTPLSYAVNWGDGDTFGPEVFTTPPVLLHTYNQRGTFNEVHTVTDHMSQSHVVGPRAFTVT